ncbi:aminoglycoside phosphotransferase family protein [Streptomyces roseoverticillatus]|uniref:aminoglycoside phosphotransferase family protein n=1 Tax=Streptomyces roseoverticillatus TaxID=66429 RepID=UPI001F26C813|nr:aminoglycoside phosphotransferase family protein [Streptomyces roseoverticillatus]MCF3105985.1 aminoglycoside phosphotransferase family protein [Streptomyces roseoverticillatus]
MMTSASHSLAGIASPVGGSTSSPRREALPNESGPSKARTRSWLASLGIDRGDIVHIQTFAARNSVAMLHFEDGTALFLKQVDPATAKAVGTATGNEETILRLIPEVGVPDFAMAAVPRFIAVDPKTETLIMEGKAGFTSMREVTRNSPEIPVPVLAALASVTAGIHTTPVDRIVADARFGPQLIVFPFASFVALTPGELASGPGMDYSDYAAAMQSVDENVARLRDEWGPKGLVHFDLRDDNILIKNGDGERPRVALVDWELAGFGDPMLDVGTVVGQLLIQWLETLREDASRLSDADTWATVRRNVGLFLTAYEHSAPLLADQQDAVFRYAGLSTLMYAAGRLEQIGSLGRIGHLCLFVGCKLLNDPQGLARLLTPGFPRKAGA